MFTVGDIEADVKRVLGACDDTTFFNYVNHAVEILASESEWNPLLGYVDVCVGCDRYITLPRQVGTVLAVNVGVRPSLGHDFWFKFHLNGPGLDTGASSDYHWYDGLRVATFRDPPRTGTKLATVIETSADNGKAFRVYGYDENGVEVRSVEGGVPVSGALVSMNAATNVATTKKFRYITRITKPVTVGTVSLYTVDADGALDTKIGEYFPTETDPQYRRIQISHSCTWARVAFRRNVGALTDRSDLIPLHSKYAVILMTKALKKWDDDRLEDGMAYKAQAVKLLETKQLSDEIPGGPSVQMAPGNLIADRADRIDG